MFAHDDPKRHIVKLHSPKQFISGGVDKDLSAKIAHNDIVGWNMSKSNSPATDFLFHYFSLQNFGMWDFPECTLANNDYGIHEDKKLADPTHYDTPLFSRAFNFNQLLSIHKVDLAERTGEGVDGVSHLDLLHFWRV